MERLISKSKNDVEVKEKYQVKISNRFEVYENLDDNVDINRACGSISKNIKALATDSLGYDGLMMSVQKYFIKGSRINCNDCRLQVE
jgi:hypothetical protein